MSVITQVTNPADDSVALKAKGIIKRLFIKRINADGSPKVTHINKGQNAGKTISATHRYSILLTVDGNDEFVSFGEGEVKNLKYEDQFQVKTADGYKNLVAGQEISVYPVVKQEYQSNGETKTSYQGKRKDVKILTEAPAGSAPQQSSGSAPAQSGGGMKIFGEITAIDGNTATVNDEKNGPGNVILSAEQLAGVQVGGRMAAFVNVATGEILNSFKAYGPAGQGGGSGGKKSGGYDQVGVETGHAINGLKELMGAGYKVKDELETAKAIHRATLDMKAFVAERTGKPVDSNPVGASAGNAILVACSRFNAKSDVSEATILEAAKNVYETLSTPIYEYISTLGKAESQTPAQSAPEPLASGPVNDVPPTDFDDTPPMDFDDDLPF